MDKKNIYPKIKLLNKFIKMCTFGTSSAIIELLYIYRVLFLATTKTKNYISPLLVRIFELLIHEDIKKNVR